MSLRGKVMRIISESEDLSQLVENEETEEIADNDDVIEETEMKVVEERIFTQVTASQVLTSLAASLGTLMIGYCTAYTSPALISMQQNGSSVPVSPDEASWIGSLMPLFALPGGLVGGTLIEKVGRKMAIEMTALPFATAGMIIAFAPRIELIYLGRIIQGLAVGVLSLAIPVYLAETSHNSVRGTLALIPGTLGAVGILVCYTAGTFLNWRALSALSSLLGLVFFSFAHFLPSSPHWLLSKGRREDAYRCLTSLRHKRFDVHSEITVMELSVQCDQPYRNDFLALIEPQNVKALLIVTSLMLVQQLCGINAVVFYSASIFQDAGSSIHENLSSIILASITIVTTIITALLIDRAGRRPLLIASSLIMGISLVSLGGFLYVQAFDPDTVAHLGWIPLCILIVVVSGFTLGLGPVPWLIMSELFSSDIRATASAVATACNWTSVFVVTKLFPILVDKIGNYAMFWIFSGVCFIGTIFIVLCVPETMGKTLEQIQQELDPAAVTSESETAVQTEYTGSSENTVEETDKSVVNQAGASSDEAN